MTRPIARVAVALAVCASVTAACADDGNDHAVRAARLAARLDAAREQPTATTGPRPEPVPASPAGEPAAPVATAPSVASDPPRTGEIVVVTALDNSFRPAEVTVRVGDEVVWENRGRNEHDLLSIEGTLADGTAWGVTTTDFQPGDVYSHVFTEPGEYRYYCTIHGTADVGMTGTVVVTT